MVLCARPCTGMVSKFSNSSGDLDRWWQAWAERDDFEFAAWHGDEYRHATA